MIMKLINKSIYVLSLASMLGLWSCSADEEVPGMGNTGKPVPLTITVSRDGAQTRTELSENAAGGLSDKWLAGDELKIYDSNGNEAGTLRLESGADKATAVFAGELTNGTTGVYRLWYFGQPVEGGYPNLELTQDNKVNRINLTNQSFKSAKDLSALDIMSKNVSITVSGDVARVAESITMEPQLAMARFKLTGIAGKSGNLVITNPGNNEGMLYAKQLNLSNPASSEDIFSQEEGINVPIDGNGGDVYIAFAPSAYTLKFTFTTTDGDVYVYQFEKSTTLEAGRYYCSWTEGEDASGVEIPLEVEEAPNNPGDTGSWGGENIEPAYELGTVTWTTDEDCWTVNCRNMAHTGGFGTYITYTHNGIQNNLLTSKGTTAYFFQWGRWLGYPSTAARTYFQNDEVHGRYPVSSQYLNGINIYNTELGYVGNDGLVPSYVAAYMGGNNSFTRKKALNWSILFGMVSSFVGGHGDYIYANEECRWEERCGNPCPDGYRVPTASELEALIPTTGEISGKYAEIKKINGVSYAMRWQVVTGTLPYVEIKSVKTTLTKITFDNAIFNSAPAIRLYAYGYMDNEGDLQGRGSVGVYWSSESGVNTISNTTGNGGKYLEIDFSGSKAVMGIGVALRCFGAPVMPIKDDNAKTATLTPLLPLIVYHEDCKFF